LGNGRKGYLERTIHSWETNLIEKPTNKVIFDDSGNNEYIDYLTEKFGNEYKIVQIADKPMGQVYAMNFIYEYLSKLDTDYFLQLEEDWVLLRPIAISKLINILKDNNNILQVRLPRTIVNLEDLKYGSTTGRLINSDNTSKSAFITKNDESWYEWTGDLWFWSHNPSVYHRDILSKVYPNSGVYDHERTFGINLLNENKDYLIAIYSSNLYDAYVHHIGIHDNNVLKYIESFDPFTDTI
jgi:hypothetical protein